MSNNNCIPKKHKKDNSSKTSIIVMISVIVLVYLTIEAFGITCPIKYITGISCAGCGMSRAWFSLLRLDISSAFMYHPLFFVPPVALVIFLFKNKINKKLYNLLLYIMLGTFIAVYIYRLMAADGDIVVFQPYNNILFRFWRILK